MFILRFFWKIITTIWYVISFTWLWHLIFGKKKAVSGTDLSCVNIHFLPIYGANVDNFEREFKKIFGGDCQNLIGNKKIPYLGYEYRKICHSRKDDLFDSLVGFYDQINSRDGKYRCCGRIPTPECVVNQNTAKELKDSEFFIVLDENDYSDHVIEHAFDEQHSIILPIYMAKELADNQIEDICRHCGVDISKNVDQNIEKCRNCDSPLSDVLRDTKGKFNASKVTENVYKAMKQLKEEIGYVD